MRKIERIFLHCTTAVMDGIQAAITNGREQKEEQA